MNLSGLNMKKFFFLIIFSFLFQLSSLAQTGWKLIYTFNQNIQCIAFKDSLNGFISPLSAGSIIFRTTDGGLTWNNLNVNNLNAMITKIIFVNNLLGIGVGSGGTIIMTRDGGDTWFAKNIGDTADLLSVCSTSDGKIIANSLNGIYLSTDYGNNWSKQIISGAQLSEINFTNAKTGFGVGYYETSIKTTDGGSTWFTIPPIISGVSMFAIKFMNATTGYVVGSSYISKTTDGGNSWTAKYNTGNAQLNDITASGNNVSWVVGSNYILKTTDIGESWNQQPFAPYHYLTSVACIDSLICFAISADGVLYKTINGGLSAPELSSPGSGSTQLPLTLSLSWNSQSSGNMFRLQVASDSDFNKLSIDTLVSGTKAQVGVLDFNTDYYWRVQELSGGITSPYSIPWNFRTTNGAPGLLSPVNNSFSIPLPIKFLWKDVSLSADSYQLQICIDSTFSTFVFNDSTINSDSLLINQLSDNTLYYWRVRSKVNNIFGHWSDKWEFITLGNTPNLIFPKNNSIDIYGNTLMQWSITDKTIDYTLQVSTDSLFMKMIINDEGITETSKEVTLGLNTKYFWRVGSRNSNGQTYWSDSSTFTTSMYNGVFPLMSGNKWYYQAGHLQSTGYYGIIKEISNDTLNNGFYEITSKYYYPDSIHIVKEYWAELNGLFYVNSNPSTSGASLYYNDSLHSNYHYFDGHSQENWNLINYEIFNISDVAQEHDMYYYSMNTFQSYISIVFPHIGIVKNFETIKSNGNLDIEDSIYLVGLYDNGKLLGDSVLSNLTGLKKINTLPNNFYLSQNYPNPFNPTTIISYQIPNSGFISLKVFDILGREVKTLVNEVKNAGSYSVEFNAINLVSGVYFYRIESGKYSASKKLLLLK